MILNFTWRLVLLSGESWISFNTIEGPLHIGDVLSALVDAAPENVLGCVQVRVDGGSWETHYATGDLDDVIYALNFET